jgi:hypothetical protein
LQKQFEAVQIPTPVEKFSGNTYSWLGRTNE